MIAYYGIEGNIDVITRVQKYSTQIINLGE